MSQELNNKNRDDVPTRRRASTWVVFAISLIGMSLLAVASVWLLPGGLAPATPGLEVGIPVSNHTDTHPAIAARKLHQVNNQNGFIVSLSRIERAEHQTRVFVAIENTSAHTVSMYIDSTYLVQGGEQLEPISAHPVGQERLHSGAYSPGMKSSGVITYPAVASLDNIAFYAMAPYSNTRDLDWRDMTLQLRAQQ